MVSPRARNRLTGLVLELQDVRCGAMSSPSSLFAAVREVGRLGKCASRAACSAFPSLDEGEIGRVRWFPPAGRIGRSPPRGASLRKQLEQDAFRTSLALAGLGHDQRDDVDT
jgi:hypothetical protein